MRHEYRGGLRHNSRVDYDLEIVDVDKVLNYNLSMIGKFLVLLLALTALATAGGLSQELLPSEPLLLQVYKQLILQDDRVVHVAIVVKVKVVIKDLLNLIRKEA